MVLFGGSTTTVTNEDQRWIASREENIEVIGYTADVSTFTLANHFPDGALLSGIAVGVITASGKVGPYDNAAVDGRTVCIGHLYATRPVDTTDLTSDQDVSVLRRGIVDESALPDAGAMTNGGIDANGKTDVAGAIIYI